MRHVIHMPHSIYVSVTRQTNTNKKSYTHQLHNFQCKCRIRYALRIIGHVAEDDFVFLTPHQLMHIGRRIGFTISRLISFYCLWAIGFALDFPPSEIEQGVKDTCLWHSLSGEATSVSQFPVSKATRRASLRVEKFWPQRKSILSRLSICKICFPSTT